MVFQGPLDTSVSYHHEPIVWSFRKVRSPSRFSIPTIIVLATTVTFALLCDTPSRYCIEYSNGSLHDVLTFELIAVLSAILAVLGYLRASVLHQSEEEAQRIATDSEETNASGIVDDEAEHREAVAPLLESDANIPSQA